MNQLTHLSLFSGIDGLDLAAEWAGFHTVGQCEYADYPTKILEKHWPNVPRWRDIGALFSGERIAIVAASNDGITAVRRDRKLQTDEEACGIGSNNGRRAAEPDQWRRWEIQSRPYGVDDGVPDRVDGIRC